MKIRLLLAILVLVVLAACKIGGSDTRTDSVDGCTTVTGACSENSDCCSYGCEFGVCVPNPVEGGPCKTTDDCVIGHLCKSRACTTYSPGMCRDDADVCTSRTECCSGNCPGGICTVNQPPIADAGPDVPDVPYTQLYTLANLTGPDPDGDPVIYGWSFQDWPGRIGGTPAPILSSTTARNPTFTPPSKGIYVLRLVVTDGPTGTPNRLSTQDEVTLNVVNHVPIATLAVDPVTCGSSTTASRNVPCQINGSVSDPDQDLLDCAWAVTAPGDTQATVVVPAAPCNNPSSPMHAFVATREGPYRVELLVNDHDRITTAHENLTVAYVDLTAVNDPPVPVVNPRPFYANLGPPSGPNPPVTLDASGSTDPNGDHLLVPGLSFFWEMVSASDSGALPSITDFDTATPSFVPDRAADYLLRLTVTDQPRPDFGRSAGASATLDVTVTVGKYIQLLGHDVLASAFVKNAGTSGKLVMAGHDPSDPGTTKTKGMLWIYDVATATEAPGIPLTDPVDPTASGIPKLLAVNTDGSKVVIVDEGISVWVVSLGTTTNMTRIARPFTVGDLVVAGTRHAYLFKTTGDAYVQELDLNNPSGFTSRFSGYGLHGASYSGTGGTYLYRLDSYFNRWDKYNVGNNGAGNTAMVSATAPLCGYADPSAIWATLDNQYIFTSCGNAYRSDTLASLGTNIGMSPAHMDSTSLGAILAIDSGLDIELFNAALQNTGIDVLPRWGDAGYGRTAYASRAFFDTGGTKRIAVVSDTATPKRYGIVTFE